MTTATLPTLDVERTPVHAADAVGAGTREVRHGVDSWLLVRNARAHGASLASAGTIRVLHATSSVTQRIGDLGHGTDVKLRVIGVPTHGVSVRSIRVPIRRYKTSTVVAGTPQFRLQPDLRALVGHGYRGLFARWIGGAAAPPALLVLNNTTDALLRGSPAHSHKTSSSVAQAVRPTHRTDAWILPAHTWAHTTDSGIHGARALPMYTDILRWKIVVQTQLTDSWHTYTYAGVYTTDAMLLRVKIRAHKADATSAKFQQIDHETDTTLWKVPGVAHLTDAISVALRARSHKTSTVTTRSPITGRWASPRVGTRVSIQVSSKDRQRGSNDYPIGFLLVAHDRITPILGAMTTVKLFKPGIGWVLAAGTTTELENGWYELESNLADRDVPGENILMAAAPGADTVWTKFDVVVPATYDPITLIPAERNALADVTLTRAFTSVASIAARSLIQAARSLWYWRAAPGSPLLVKVDDGTTAWKAAVVTDPTIQPIRGMDPIDPDV